MSERQRRDVVLLVGECGGILLVGMGMEGGNACDNNQIHWETLLPGP